MSMRTAPTGKNAIGGGFEVTDVNLPTPAWLASVPLRNFVTGVIYAWRTAARNDSTVTVGIASFAICAITS
jgi:hypothetical protein